MSLAGWAAANASYAAARGETGGSGRVNRPAPRRKGSHATRQALQGVGKIGRGMRTPASMADGACFGKMETGKRAEALISPFQHPVNLRLAHGVLRIDLPKGGPVRRAQHAIGHKLSEEIVRDVVGIAVVAR